MININIYLRLLKFIYEYQNKIRRPPSIREMTWGARMKSTSFTTYYLKIAIENKHVEVVGVKGQSRRYRVNEENYLNFIAEREEEKEKTEARNG